MKKLHCACTFFIIAQLLSAQPIQPLLAYPGYYITLSNDTVKATIQYSNIMSIQHSLRVTDALGTLLTFFPNEIKGFCLRAGQPAERFRHYGKDYIASYGMDPLPPGYVFTSLFSIPQTDTVIYYKSISMPGNNKPLFLNVVLGNGQALSYLAYYYLYTNSGKYTYVERLAYVGMVYKDGALLPMSHKKPGRFHTFMAKAVADYKLLSDMTARRLLSANNPTMNVQFPNLSLIIKEYNDWRKKTGVNAMDTSLALKGILDANTFYSPGFTYWGTAIPSCAFVLPGLVIGQAVFNHPPKPQQLNIPKNCTYCKDPNYVEAYQMRATYIKSRALVRGIWTGVFFTFGVLVSVLIITNS